MLVLIVTVSGTNLLKFVVSSYIHGMLSYCLGTTHVCHLTAFVVPGYHSRHAVLLLGFGPRVLSHGICGVKLYLRHAVLLFGFDPRVLSHGICGVKLYLRHAILLFGINPRVLSHGICGATSFAAYTVLLFGFDPRALSHSICGATSFAACSLWSRDKRKLHIC